MKIETYLLPFTKHKFKWINDLNIKPYTEEKVKLKTVSKIFLYSQIIRGMEF